MKIYYKIIDQIDGKYKTLFHGLNGSKTIPTNQWLKAEEKLVSDGSGNKKYLSGWHLFKKTK